MDTPGYEKLADVLRRAYAQAAAGKGHERHANGEPFHQQVMQDGARRFGVGGLLFQVFKKSEESQRMPTGAAVAELLGAINYLAGAVIAREHAATPVQRIEARDIGHAIAQGTNVRPAPRTTPTDVQTHVAAEASARSAADKALDDALADAVLASLRARVIEAEARADRMRGAPNAAPLCGIGVEGMTGVAQVVRDDAARLRFLVTHRADVAIHSLGFVRVVLPVPGGVHRFEAPTLRRAIDLARQEVEGG